MNNNHLHYFTDEEKAELLSNPFTAYVTDTRVRFTLAFKKFLLKELDKPGMTLRQAFRNAGYRDDLFTPKVRESAARRFREEAASPQGLQEPAPCKESHSDKKHHQTQIWEMELRIRKLEQQVEFLNKSRHLRDHGTMPPDSII